MIQALIAVVALLSLAVLAKLVHVFKLSSEAKAVEEKMAPIPVQSEKSE
ncbi:MAG: hypothetical protein QF371_01625 [Flavobacteriales bacterium]|jgi:hypothetical protein|nr:hypothetical protein [Flavobacteriales bacterium]